MKGVGSNLQEISVNDIKQQVIKHLVCGMVTPAGKHEVNKYFSVNK